MDEKALKRALLDISAAQIDELMREAREQALAEAKAIIRKLMVQGILERALDQLGGPDGQVVSLTQATKAAPPSEPSLPAEREAERLPESGGADRVAAPDVKGDESWGYYVYAVVRGDGHEDLEALPKESVDPIHPVYVLPYQGLQAIVSRVSLSEFSQAALEAHLQDINWLETKVYAHQRILERILASHTLIPMKFCTIYHSESRVQEMLAQHHDHFASLLRQLEGKREWGVKVYCDGEALAQRVREANDRVKELQREMAEKPDGMAYFLRRKLDETVAEEAEGIRDERAQRSHDRLSSHAEESAINPLQSREMTGRREEMVLNGAYLVAEEKLAGFREELESLKEEHSRLGLSYELTGPWPPYNFVPIGPEEEAGSA